VKTFLKGYREAARYAQSHKEKSVAILQKYLKISDKSVAEYMYDMTMPYLELSLGPSPEAIQSVLDIVAFANPKAKEAKTTDYWDLTLLKELDAERGAR
jgi:ABC-type nitrate/sulfonate/bicarbonate transport system substrate-binding protein